MLRRSFFVTSVLMAALIFYLLQELDYLIPYRNEILRGYWLVILISTLVVFFNVWIPVHLLTRFIALKRTGRKLEHLDKQEQGKGRGARLPESSEDDR